jgi:hypothetical protein
LIANGAIQRRADHFATCRCVPLAGAEGWSRFQPTRAAPGARGRRAENKVHAAQIKFVAGSAPLEQRTMFSPSPNKHCLMSASLVPSGFLWSRTLFILLWLCGTPLARQELWGRKSPKDLSADW